MLVYQRVYTHNGYNLIFCWFNMVQHGSTSEAAPKARPKSGASLEVGRVPTKSEPELGTPHILESRKLESREKP